MARSQAKDGRFPWRAGNRYQLLNDGEQFFPAMLHAIAHAQQHILLDIYLFESGNIANQFIDAFITAAERGVQLYLLLDDFGARGLQLTDRRRLQHPSIHLAFYNPMHYGTMRRNLFRDHRKLLIVDQRIAFTGGAGLTDEFDSQTHPLHSWHDVMLSIRGPVVSDWQHTFSQSWNLWGSPPLSLTEITQPTAGGGPGRVSLNTPSRMEIKRSLINRIRGAEKSVWIATAYFIPSWKIRRLLRHAAHRGVDVRLLLPGPHTDHPSVRHAGRRFYGRLLLNGVRIFEYQPRFLHAKMLLCDDWLSIGSSNIDRWNLRWNLEANQELLGGEVIEQAYTLFSRDFEQSHEISHDFWRARPWYRRLPEWFWGKIDRWLERCTRHNRKSRDNRKNQAPGATGGDEKKG
ncbi:MAG: phospholipase D-like domain-containing protein [Pseudomonadota bacterium]